MKVRLSQIDGRWTAEVDGKVHILKAPSSVRLTQVVEGIRRFYPGVKLSLDQHLSENPFLRHSVQIAETYRSEPIWKDIEAMLENPSVKVCSRCMTQAWYDAHVRNYRCPKCRAVASQVDPDRFFRVIARHDKWRQ